MKTAFDGKVIAIPENRQLDLLVQLFEKRGATVHQFPLIAILDAPDPEPVLAWIKRFIASPPDYFVILTGEGLRRLDTLAEREGILSDFVAALGKCKTLCRGPKPGRALAKYKLAINIPAAAPTTTGVIATLQQLNATEPLRNKRVAVQLYGEEPNVRLSNALTELDAEVDTVAPYIYADQSAEQKVVELITELAANHIDVIAFTSQPQYLRLLQVAKAHNLVEQLDIGLKQTSIAVVGPVVRDQLEKAGYAVAIMPERTFFMKPMVSAIMRFLET